MDVLNCAKYVREFASKRYCSVYHKELKDFYEFENNTSEELPISLLETMSEAARLSNRLYDLNISDGYVLSYGIDGKPDCHAIYSQNNPSTMWVISR